jgi:hypothetical protein
MNVVLIHLVKHVVHSTLVFIWYSYFFLFLTLKYSFYYHGYLVARIQDLLALLV